MLLKMIKNIKKNTNINFYFFISFLIFLSFVFGLVRIIFFGPFISQKVNYGKDFWIYYETDTHMYEYQKPLSNNELEAMRTSLRQQRDYFNSQGIDYYWLVAPNSQSIYPEFLLDKFRSNKPNNRYDNFYSYLQSYPEKKIVIDVKEELLKNKKYNIPSEIRGLEGSSSSTILYYKQDIHWNYFGAYLAYSKILNELSEKHKCLKLLPITDFELKVAKSNSRLPVLKEIYPGSDINYVLSIDDSKNIKIQCPELKLVLVGDSMIATYMKKWLRLNFGEFTVIHKSIPLKEKLRRISEIKPDIIIEEGTERGMQDMFYNF